MYDTARPRRSALYMPASNPRALAKARSLAADVIILDLEDAVAPEAKESAREAAIAAAAEGGFGHRELIIRINALDTPWGQDDLAAVVRADIDGVLIPKVSRPSDITACNAALADAPSRLKLWAMIETCAVVPHLDALAALGASTRLSTFVMGVNDLAKEMRAKLTPERTPFLPILTLTVAAARAHGVAVLDGVCNEFRDLDVFEAEARQGLMFGFDGKTLIHPDQVAPCNAVYSPSEDELAWAHAVIAAFALPENAGKGAIRVEGRMAELLHLEQAHQLVAIAQQIAAQG